MWILFLALAGVGLVVCFMIGRHDLKSVHEEVRTGLEAEEERRLAAKGRRELRQRGNKQETNGALKS